MTGVSLISGVRVLEIGLGTGVRYAGRLLADLGAQVSQQIEGPSASQGTDDRTSRALAGYLDRGKDTVGRAASGDWDLILIEETKGRVEDNVETITPGSGHVRVVVSGDAPGTDLCASARGGVSWVIGNPEREPLSLPYNMAGFLAGTSAAAAGLLALYAREGHGGQQVAVSADSILAWFVSMNSVVTRYGSAWHREGRRAAGSAGPYPYGIFDCADGQVTIIARSSLEWHNFIEAIGHPAWADEPRYQDLIAMGSEYPDEVDALLTPVLRQFTQRELLERAQEFGFALAPVNSMRKVLEEAHFRKRGSLQDLQFDGATVTVPSAPWRLLPGRPNCVEGLRRPQRIKSAEGSGPLSGLRVLDLSWVWSGPLVTSVLADFGAEVIKVEHGGRLDSSRLRGRPFKGGKPVDGPSIEIAPYFHNVNRGKKSIALDLARPEARLILHELASQSDVVVENMRVGVLERLGLGWNHLQAINSRMVYLSMSGFGQTGPLAAMSAYAPVMSSFAGLESLIGYPGEDPIGMMTLGLGDPNAALHALTVLLAALRFVREGNPGMMIDLSQTDSLLPLVTEALLEQQFTGTVKIRGNTEPSVVPRGIYPTTGHDQWIAISIPDDAVWRRFCQTVVTSANVRRLQDREDVSWALDSRYHAIDGRAADCAKLDAAIARWSAEFHPEHLLALLCENEVPAAPVNRDVDLDEDPFLGRGSLWTSVNQPIIGRTNLSRIPWVFAATPPRVRGPAPLLGQHTRHVLVDILGMGDADVDELLSTVAIA